MPDQEKHFYGGQAVIEGVMMRSKTHSATAVRRRNGSTIVQMLRVGRFVERYPWARWPLVRGTVALVDALVLGITSLQFSGDIAMQDALEQETEERAQCGGEEPAPTTGGRGFVYGLLALVAGAALAYFAAPQLSRFVPGMTIAGRHLTPLLATRLGLGLAALLVTLYLLLSGRQPQSSAAAAGSTSTTVWLAMVPAGLIGIGLFILAPSALAGLFGPGKSAAGTGAAHAEWAVARNVVEGVLRLGLILGYIAAISLLGQVRRVFQHHGAEHQVINTYEAGEEVTVENAEHHSPLHPRCGTAFLLSFIVLKIIVGALFGWPAWPVRFALRIGLIPVVAAIAFEMSYYAGRHRDSRFAQVLAAPGLWLQRLTTRKPDRGMIEVAVTALASVAPEVSLPTDWAPVVMWNGAKPVEETAEAASPPQAAGS